MSSQDSLNVCISNSIDDDSEDSSYVHNLRVQIEEGLNQRAKELEQESINDMHRDSGVFFLNFYAKAMNPSEDYLQALELCGLPSEQAYANVAGTYRKYCEDNNSVLYMPKFDAGTWNPLNDLNNVRERASRSAGNFMDTLRSNKMAFVKPTFPKGISEAYAESDNKSEFRDRAWDTLKTFFHDLQDYRTGPDNKMGMHANLHLWKTEKPFKPHLHFHCAIPMLQAPYVTSEDRERELNSGKTGRMYNQWKELDDSNGYRADLERDINRSLANDLGVDKLGMHDYKKNHVFDVDKLRSLWKNALEEHWSDFMDNSDVDEVNVHVDWASRINDPERIMHKFRYKNRLPTIDFFHYYEDNSISNEEYMNQDFMEHIFWYSNESRVFGFNKWGTNITDIDSNGFSARCPICGGVTREVCDDDFRDVSGKKVIQEERYGFLGFDPPDSTDLSNLFR